MTSTHITRNTIDQAIERLRGRWMQGDYGLWGTDDEPVCAMGALYWATETCSLDDRLDVINTMDRVAYDEHGCNTEDFNDDSSTTEEDVLLLMKKASARLDEMEAGR